MESASPFRLISHWTILRLEEWRARPYTGISGARHHGGPPRDLVRGKERIFRDSIAWSPEGRHVYYAKDAGDGVTDQTKELWRVSVDDGTQEFTGLRMPGMQALRMHPDGRRLAFRAGKFEAEIWVMENFLPAKLARK